MTLTSMKTLTAAALIAMASGTASFAANMDYNYIMPGKIQSLNSTVSLEVVRASAPGTVTVYDYSNGTQGAELGSASVNAGANADVKVELSANTASKALVVLTEGSSAPIATATLRDLDSM